MTFAYYPLTFSENAVHVSLDLETASLEHNAAILQIGAHTLENVNLKNFQEYVSVSSNEAAKRDFATETMEWWGLQDVELRRQVFGGMRTLQAAVNNFIGWCSYISSDNLSRVILWSKPQMFDIVILKNAVEQFVEWPFGHRNVGDVYTAMRALSPAQQQIAHDTVINDHPALQPHNALHDAIYQAAFIQSYLETTNAVY